MKELLPTEWPLSETAHQNLFAVTAWMRSMPDALRDEVGDSFHENVSDVIDELVGFSDETDVHCFVCVEIVGPRLEMVLVNNETNDEVRVPIVIKS